MSIPETGRIPNNCAITKIGPITQWKLSGSCIVFTRYYFTFHTTSLQYIDQHKKVFSFLSAFKERDFITPAEISFTQGVVKI